VEVLRAGAALKAVAEMLLPQSAPAFAGVPLAMACDDEPEAVRQCERIAAVHGKLHAVRVSSGWAWASKLA
jgi:hypothetical protein